jgi:hypothetical protein
MTARNKADSGMNGALVNILLFPVAVLNYAGGLVLWPAMPPERII